MKLARTRQGSNALKQIEELHLANKKKNNDVRKQQEDEEKCRKDEEEVKQCRIEEKAEREKEMMTPKNLHNIMNGLDSTQLGAIEIKDVEDNGDKERSPLKK
jgi:hypothetical protein